MTTVKDLVLLLARIVLGVMMIAHAKLSYDSSGKSISGVGEAFEKMNVPLGSIAGPVNLFGELFGGFAMILGAAVPLVGVLMALNMLGAWAFVHTSGLFAMDRNGPELVIALGTLSLLIAALGSGRFGIDHFVFGRRKGGRAEKTETAKAEAS